jgi:hypothetical protein
VAVTNNWSHEATEERPMTQTSTIIPANDIRPCLLTADDALELVRRCSYGHVQRAVDMYRFGPRSRALAFTDTGVLRLANIFGWLTGLGRSEPSLAAELAHHLLNKLDDLAYGPAVVDDGRQVPATIVELGDDGCFASFRLAWYSLVPRGEEVAPSCLSFPTAYERHYRYSYNGGLIFHGMSDGNGGGYPTLSVRSGHDPNPWSIHT